MSELNVTIKKTLISCRTLEKCNGMRSLLVGGGVSRSRGPGPARSGLDPAPRGGGQGSIPSAPPPCRPALHQLSRDDHHPRGVTSSPFRVCIVLSLSHAPHVIVTSRPGRGHTSRTARDTPPHTAHTRAGQLLLYRVTDNRQRSV
ncbi:unnamed protein product [Danaus chrysippus]|uniref:(African queen) hypothetical protein n=1 Tax=Danaus chrysippus TaxID=151541 RepID=A0A8J2R7Z9_9NEOP|nr:unnamed protein product [Danaus chrysippus]